MMTGPRCETIGGMLRKTPLRRKSPPKQWRRPASDKVDPAVADAVFARDRGCVPAQLGAPGPCRNAFQQVHAWDDRSQLTLEHVREAAAMGAPRAKSDMAHMVVACSGHGVQGWELANKDKLREWLHRPVRRITLDRTFEDRWGT